jgi:hypothetical protein
VICDELVIDFLWIVILYGFVDKLQEIYII